VIYLTEAVNKNICNVNLLSQRLTIFEMLKKLNNVKLIVKV